MGGELILVADDQEAVRRTLAMVLGRAGYRVMSAGDGAVAVAQCLEHRPDAVLMDLQMPFMNGWDATCALRALHPAGELPILAMSADHAILASSRISAAGFTGSLAKPFMPADVVRTVTQALRGHATEATPALAAAGGS
jgi:CheY-like chemotaxis protein